MALWYIGYYVCGRHTASHTIVDMPCVAMPLTAAVHCVCLCACVQGPAIVAFASTMSDANDVHGWFR